MKRSRIVVSVAVLVLAAGWYAFRPERLFIDDRVDEVTSTSAGDTPLARGAFHAVAHEGRGEATVIRHSDGRRVLQLTDFETSNGPELQLYLVAAGDATDSDSVKAAGFVSLGALKGNVGNQSYEIPADVDLGKYRAVTVWCRRFSVNFTTAPLRAPDATASR